MNKIAYITSSPADDINLWSGTTKNMFDNLNKITQTENIVVPQTVIHKIVHKIVFKLTSGKVNHSKIDSFFYKIEMNKKRKILQDYDILFFPAESNLLAGLGEKNQKQKIVYLSDATVHLMIDYYWFNLPNAVINILNENEMLSIKKADTLIYPSQWVASDAINYYKAKKSKVSVVPFGANLPDRYKKKQSKKKRLIKLLLVGVDWKRKGVEKAIETIKILNKDSLKYELTVVGCMPASGEYFPDYIKFVSKLNKNNVKDENELIRIYQESDIFLLPTQAECAGIVFCEAAMYGLPSISYDTGGVSSYVKDGVTGYLLHEGASADKFAEKISFIINNDLLYKMSLDSRKLYEDCLNWKQWTKSVKKVLKIDK